MKIRSVRARGTLTVVLFMVGIVFVACNPALTTASELTTPTTTELTETVEQTTSTATEPEPEPEPTETPVLPTITPEASPTDAFKAFADQGVGGFISLPDQLLAADIQGMPIGEVKEGRFEPFPKNCYDHDMLVRIQEQIDPDETKTWFESQQVITMKDEGFLYPTLASFETVPSASGEFSGSFKSPDTIYTSLFNDGYIAAHGFCRRPDGTYLAVYLAWSNINVEPYRVFPYIVGKVEPNGSYTSITPFVSIDIATKGQDDFFMFDDVPTKAERRPKNLTQAITTLNYLRDKRTHVVISFLESCQKNAPSAIIKAAQNGALRFRGYKNNPWLQAWIQSPDSLPLYEREQIIYPGGEKWSDYWTRRFDMLQDGQLASYVGFVADGIWMNQDLPPIDE